MNRRTALGWISTLLGAASALAVGIPGVSFVLSGLLGRQPDKAIVQRVARVRDLVPGKPVQVSVIGGRRDAWTLYPDEVIGRVWLVLAKGGAAGDVPQVTALTAICPHLGCTVQLDAGKGNFICPCHRAEFDLGGQRITSDKSGRGNHAPRGMDSLECRVIRDEPDAEWWVEVKYEKFEQGLTRKVSRT